MEPEDALDAMAYLIQHGAVQKMVAAVDWQLWKPVYESRTERHLVNSIAVEAVAAVPAETSLPAGRLRSPGRDCSNRSRGKFAKFWRLTTGNRWTGTAASSKWAWTP